MRGREMATRNGAVAVKGDMIDVRDRIRRFLHECFILDGALEALDNDASFLESGIVDSTGVLELVLFAEEVFAIDVEDHEVTPANFDSVNRFAAYLCRKVAQRGTAGHPGS